jgi:hypothetical protein
MKHNLFTLILIAAFSGIVVPVGGCTENKDNNIEKTVCRKGIAVYPDDITSIGIKKYVGIMKTAGLNLLGIHGFNDEETPAKIKSFIESSDGRMLYEECKKNNIDIEFETHAIHILLPRQLFGEHPEYFRMDEKGIRRNDLNMCFSSDGAYSEIKKNITEMVKWLRPTTNRYFFWTDDGMNGYCHCDSCKKYSESEQALIYENRLLKMLREINPAATLAHLAYNNTYQAPSKIKPSGGIFLEYAPIDRDLSKPVPENHVLHLANNLKVFPAQTAHVLEYWVDVSKFSGWDKDHLVKIPWNMENCKRDAGFYKSLGISSITSFAVWLNKDYFEQYGEDTAVKVICEYGTALDGKPQNQK